MSSIASHEELRVYQLAIEVAMEIFVISRGFPAEERYSLTDQIRRSSRSVSANIAEAFRKRRYPKSFIAKLSDAEGEAAETQVWLDFAFKCGYIDQQTYQQYHNKYHSILGMIVTMINHPEKWGI